MEALTCTAYSQVASIAGKRCRPQMVESTNSSHPPAAALQLGREYQRGTGGIERSAGGSAFPSPWRPLQYPFCVHHNDNLRMCRPRNWVISYWQAPDFGLSCGSETPSKPCQPAWPQEPLKINHWPNWWPRNAASMIRARNGFFAGIPTPPIASPARWSATAKIWCSQKRCALGRKAMLADFKRSCHMFPERAIAR